MVRNADSNVGVPLDSAERGSRPRLPVRFIARRWDWQGAAPTRESRLKRCPVEPCSPVLRADIGRVRVRGVLVAEDERGPHVGLVARSEEGA